MVVKDPRKIQSMFGAIAPVYDALNHVFSLNIDRMWRRFTVRQALRADDRRVLDIACGTGDLTIELRRRAPEGCEVFGGDFCLPMLQRAQGKAPGGFLQCDGLNLPFPDATFDLVTVAFGLRNMADTRDGLREMRRVLKPGGRLAVLEFTTPKNPVIRASYLFYFQVFLPFIGNLVSRSTAYRYLSESVMEWPSPKMLARMMRQSGFDRVRGSQLTFGIAALHIAECTKKRNANT